MADFRRKRKFKTTNPQLKVVAGLPVGIHTFQLVVEDQSGNRSQAAQIKIRVFGGREPVRLRRGGDVLVDTPVVTRRGRIRRPPG